METAQILSGMFKERVGHSIIDSGDYYGRQYERNQKLDLDAEERSTLRFSAWKSGDEERLSVELSHNTYHWLKERLELNEELNKLMQDEDSPFRKEHDEDGRASWFELADVFPEWLSSAKDENGEEYGECKGIYGDGEPFTINTYNEENCLDQTIQFKYFENERFGSVIVLQVHGGCDVRMGYTAAQVFTVDESTFGELAIFDYQRAAIYCDDERHPTAEALKEAQEKQLKLKGVSDVEDDIDWDGRHIWDTDDGGYSFSDQTYPVDETFEIESKCKIKLLTEEDNVWESGVLCIDEEGNGYCPHCGGKLKSDFF